MTAENSDMSFVPPIAVPGDFDAADVSSTAQPIALNEVNESYFQLVWRRFKRSKVSIVGGLMVLTLAMLAIFADFFSPTPIDEIDLKSSFIPPQQVHFVDSDSNLHLQPFVYNYVYDLDPKTFRAIWKEDTTKIYYVNFFVQGFEYKVLGIFPSTLHFYAWKRVARSIFLAQTNWAAIC